MIIRGSTGSPTARQRWFAVFVRDFFMRPTPPWNPFSCRAAAMSASEGWKGGDEGHGRSD